MQKALGALIMVLLLWTAVELFAYGPSGAFGGMFASFVDESEPGFSPQRTGERLRDRNRERADTIERLSGG